MKSAWRGDSAHYFVHYTNGSLKAACTFAEKFLNTRFVIPSHNNYGLHEGVRTLPLAKVTVPEKFSYRQKARFAQMSDMGGILYSIANNFYFAPGVTYLFFHIALKLHEHGLSVLSYQTALRYNHLLPYQVP